MSGSRRSRIEWNAMNPNRRLRHRLGAALAALALPASAIFVAPAAGYGCCSDPSGVVVRTQGTVCWEKGETPTQRPVVVVWISTAAKDPVTVLLDTTDGTAVAPDDYAAIKGLKVTIPAGALRVEVPLSIRSDAAIEPDEYFTVTLSQPSSGQVDKIPAVVVIRDGSPPGK
jgi:hypothetical protein